MNYINNTIIMDIINEKDKDKDKEDIINLYEQVSLDNSLLQKFNVKLYGSDFEIYDIINDYLQDNGSDHAFYIVDLGMLLNSYVNWLQLLPNIKPYYAIKCNPNPVILNALSEMGLNFDCASEAEIKSVIDITEDPNRIIFANPCKMTSQIRYARANDVDLMTFDCEEELYKIKLYHPYAKLILRLIVDDSKSICKFNSKYGTKLEEVEELLNICKTLKLDVVGFSFHVGSGCSDSGVFYEAIHDCKKAVEIANHLNIQCSIIDIGGGFPGNIQKFEEIAKSINSAMNDFFSEELENNTIRFIAEPGRYFAEKTHTLVLNIIGKKKIKDKDGETIIIYYLNDGMYGSFNCIYFDHSNPVIMPFNERDGKLHRSRLFGPTCDSMDLITENIMLPELAIGEWVYVENFGAYTIAASSNFNGFKTSVCKYVFRS